VGEGVRFIMSRISLVGIGSIYLIFLLLFLTGKGIEGPQNNAVGVLIFALFALSLILHTTLVISARSWPMGLLCLLSVCALFVSLFWVLHSVTGDSL
jgi:uncharacterized membrane protein